MKFPPPNAKCLLPSASMLAVLCLLSSVLCQPSRAAGSWLVDGKAVLLPAEDPNALYTDGSRSMTSQFSFDNSVPILFRAYIPWTAAYADIFVLDEDEEVLWLTTDQNVSFGVGSLIISSVQLTSLTYGSFINFEGRSFGGGGWFMSSVADDPYAVLNRTYADTRYIQRSEGITVNHTVQAGDVLHIQNGVITAINP